MWTQKAKNQRLEKQSSSNRINEQVVGRGGWSQRSSWREQAVTQTMLALSTGPGLPREQGAQPASKRHMQRLRWILFSTGVVPPLQTSSTSALGELLNCQFCATNHYPPTGRCSSVAPSGVGTPPHNGLGLLDGLLWVFIKLPNLILLSTKRTIQQVLNVMWFPWIPLQESSYFLSPCSQAPFQRQKKGI